MTTKKFLQNLIVADVGGTNGRFAVASFDAGEIHLSHEFSCSNDGLAGFAELLSLYLDELGADAPSCACFATAGPNDGRRGMLTNLGWHLDAAVLESRFGLDDIFFVNDFRALARMAPDLADSDSLILSAGSSQSSAGSSQSSTPISVIGPGTGLGVALVLPREDATVAVATEGGHMAFAPGNQLEVALRNYLAMEYPHVHAELLLSGNGLRRIHDFLAAEYGAGTIDLSPAEITDAALQGDDDCTRSVSMFLSILGSVAGDVALCHGALGGVFLGGGMLRRILPLVESSDLCQRFCAKGVMREYLSSIPIRVITAHQVARRGAARLYRERGQ